MADERWYNMEQLNLFIEQMKNQAIEYYKKIHAEYKVKKNEQWSIYELEHSMTKEEKLESVVNKNKVKKWVIDYSRGSYGNRESIPIYYLCRSNELYDENNEWLEESTNKKMAQEIKGYSKIETFGERVEEMMTKEFERKRISLIKRIEKKGGKIVDAIELHYGYDSGINGTIECENNIVKIETIFAGGYNIQCLHYRVLIKVINKGTKGGKNEVE